jgi:hypothetical protein
MQAEGLMMTAEIQGTVDQLLLIAAGDACPGGERHPAFIGCVARIPRFKDDAEEGDFMRRHAAALEAVLYEALPGAVYDQLWQLMWARGSRPAWATGTRYTRASLKED